jgi:hypothetical protein
VSEKGGSAVRPFGGDSAVRRFGGDSAVRRFGGDSAVRRFIVILFLFSAKFCSSLLFFSLLFASLLISFLIRQKRVPSCRLRDLYTLFCSRCPLLFSSFLFYYFLFSSFLCSDSTKTIPALCDLEISLLLNSLPFSLDIFSMLFYSLLFTDFSKLRGSRL